MVVVGAEEDNAISIDFHGSSTGGPHRAKKTRDVICKRFYWRGMSADIDKLVSEVLISYVSHYVGYMTIVRG